MEISVHRMKVVYIFLRLRSANTELEDASVSEKLVRLKKDVETADKISELNRQIYTELDRINDFNKRIKTVESWMVEEKQSHLDRVETANEKYETTRMKITSEIKALSIIIYRMMSELFWCDIKARAYNLEQLS